VLILLFDFDDSERDVATLARLSQIAAAGGMACIAAARGTVVGCTSVADRADADEWARHPTSVSWRRLTGIAQAQFLSLVWPRFLLRMPYGARTDPIESFAFEEMPDSPAHETYLWGSSAIVGACLLAEAFRTAGWNLRSDQTFELAELPVYVCERAGEHVARACGEVPLSERAGAHVAARGVTPLWSASGRDAVRLSGLRAVGGGSLRGRWRSA
jgi:type VI secretion system protein ImpC